MIGTTRIASAVLLMAGTASVSLAQLHAGLELRQDVQVADDVPVQVLDIERSDAGVRVRMLNAAALPVVAVQVITGETTHDQNLVHFMGVASTSPIEWRPGQEWVVQIYTEGLSHAPAARVRAIILADGTGYGDPRAVSGFRQRFKDSYESAVDVLAHLAGPSPADDDSLRDLIERLRLAKTKATAHPSGASDERVSAYTFTIEHLERLHGRAITGTDKMERELASVRTRLREQCDASRRFPFAVRGQRPLAP